LSTYFIPSFFNNYLLKFVHHSQIIRSVTRILILCIYCTKCGNFLVGQSYFLSDYCLKTHSQYFIKEYEFWTKIRSDLGQNFLTLMRHWKQKSALESKIIICFIWFFFQKCRLEMQEIENCPDCYLNAHTKKDSWFVAACVSFKFDLLKIWPTMYFKCYFQRIPHLLVWAKMTGFPYWPGKAMRVNKENNVDVRFFGAHDKAWLPSKDVFLYSTVTNFSPINCSLICLLLPIEFYKCRDGPWPGHTSDQP